MTGSWFLAVHEVKNRRLASSCANLRLQEGVVGRASWDCSLCWTQRVITPCAPWKSYARVAVFSYLSMKGTVPNCQPRKLWCH